MTDFNPLLAVMNNAMRELLRTNDESVVNLALQNFCNESYFNLERASNEILERHMIRLNEVHGAYLNQPFDTPYYTRLVNAFFPGVPCTFASFERYTGQAICDRYVEVTVESKGETYVIDPVMFARNPSESVILCNDTMLRIFNIVSPGIRNLILSSIGSAFVGIPSTCRVDALGFTLKFNAVATYVEYAPLSVVAGDSEPW